MQNKVSNIQCFGTLERTMKKNYLSLLCLASLFTLSCGEPTNPSSEPDSSVDTSKTDTDQTTTTPDTSTEDSSSSLIETHPEATGTAKEVFDFIEAAAKGNNYTLTINSGDTSSNVIYNSRYIYYEVSNAGYIALTSYKETSSTILYNFSGKNHINIENAASYTDKDGNRQVISSVSTLNALNDGVTASTEEDLYVNWDYFATKNTTLITSFAYICGIAKYASSLSAVRLQFTSEAKDELDFAFVGNFASADYDKAEAVSGCISNVGSSSVTELDTYLDAYTLPSTSLSDALVASISGKQSFNSKVTYHYKGKDIIEQEDEVVIDESNKQVTRKVDGLNSNKFTFLHKGENGNAYKKYVGADNKVKDVDQNVKFEELVIQPSTLIEKEAFRETSAGVYSYFGYNGRPFITDIADYDMGEVLSITISTSENKITALHAESTHRYDSYGQEMYFEVDLTFGGTSDFRNVVPHEGSSNAANAALVNFKYSIYPSFTVESQTVITSNPAYKKKYYFARREPSAACVDTILIDEETIDTEEGSEGDIIHVLTGYYQNEKGLLPFRVNDKNQVIASAPVIEGATIVSYLGMDINYKLFNQVEGTELTNPGDKITYQLYDDVDGVAGHFFGGVNANKIVPSSLKMDVSLLNSPAYTAPAKLVTKIEYQYDGSGLFYGTETLKFSNYGATVLPELDFSTFGDWVEPTTWEMGAPNVYSEIKDAFTPEQIALMPYIYEQKIEGNWLCDVTDDGTYVWVALFNTTYMVTPEKDDVSETYLAKYAAKLKELGFVEKAYPLASAGEGVQLYKDGVYARVTNVLSSGIRFLIEK